MKRIRFHPEADQELAEAMSWYRRRSEVAEQALALEIDHAIREIVEAPLRWPQGSRGERRFILDRFPYTLFYRLGEGHVYIIAVAHQRRRPGYWRQRK